MTLLGGGALIVNNPELGEALPPPDKASIRGNSSQRVYALKAAIYNRLISPALYWIPESLPFLGLGETTYTELKGMPSMPNHALARLDGNIRAYLQRSALPQTQLQAMLLGPRSPTLVDLAGHCTGTHSYRLLRYPMLTATKRLRDLLLASLRRAGPGATYLYGRALPCVSGLHESLRSQRDVPNAIALADRLLTLPTHSRVTNRHVEAMARIFREGGNEAT